jgi:RNA polymerase sigma-70 factor (ECF subfamily)
LEKQVAMNRFLADVEGRALRIAEIATGNREDAMELVQEAMLQLVQRYGRKATDDWPPLFHRILQSRIRDWYRRQTVRNRFKGWLGFGENDVDDPIANHPDRPALGPSARLEAHDFGRELEAALNALPLRQQQAFLLRSWEGFDVQQTATAMGCSQGSVKTHYSRAIHTLRHKLKDVRW